MIANFLVQFISLFIQLLIFAIFARVVMSWLRVTPRGFLFNIIVEATEPVLGLFRRYIPPLGGVLDLSPLFAFLALRFLLWILCAASSSPC